MRLFLCLLFGLVITPAFAQEPVSPANSTAAALPEAPAPFVAQKNGTPNLAVVIVCPGEFPTNLTVKDCTFSQRNRWDSFVINSLSDQAILGSIAGALSSQVVKSPAEWPRTWNYYGYRLGASYGGGVARGVVEFSIGSITKSDPRHVRCEEDPLSFKHYGSDLPEHCTGLKGQLVVRPVHVFTDAFTVRRSKKNGDGFRYPALERLAGIYADAYASNPWQPQVENNFAAVSRRAGSNFLFTFLGCFWNEYGPDITARFSRTSTRTYP